MTAPINDIEKHRYELGRLTLQTLINTYPDSEYIAKAKLAIADSWYREGTSHALAQAEAEYKDFITFFPTMEEAAESQMKVCRIHYEQMEKPDRDNTHAVKADNECRQMLLQYPNSVFVNETKQMLREIQEVIAEGEYRVGEFYAKKGSYRAGVNRLQAITDHYPLFSKSDEALWTLGNTYEKMGEQFQDNSVDAYAKLVRDYPLSPFVDPAKQKLTAFNHAIPEADPQRFRDDEVQRGQHLRAGHVRQGIRYVRDAARPAAGRQDRRSDDDGVRADDAARGHADDGHRAGPAQRRSERGNDQRAEQARYRTRRAPGRRGREA